MVDGKQEHRAASAFRRHLKIDDTTVIRLVYYFCQGFGIEPVSKTLGLSRKTVRAHYLDLRKRLRKPKFARWHAAYRVLPKIIDAETEHRIKGGLLEAMTVCHFSSCHANFAKQKRKNRVCRSCPLPYAFRDAQAIADAVEAIDQIKAFYKRLGILGSGGGDKGAEFFERLIHAGVIQCVHENSRRRPNGLLDPADRDFQAIGTLVQMFMDDMADEHVLRIEAPIDRRR